MASADKRRARRALAIAGALAVMMPLARPSTASAQSADDDVAAVQRFVMARRYNPDPIGFRAYALVDGDAMTASNTFKAVTGTSTFVAVGGGGEVIWHHLFGRVAASTTSHSGSRVFVFGGQVFSRGISTTITMTPLELSAGWRTNRRPRARVSAYVGGGYLHLRYRETSDEGDADENTDEAFAGYDVFGGVDWRWLNWVTVGAEAQYRGVPHAIGGPTAPAGSPAQAYNETDLGGPTVRVLFGIGH